MENRINEIIEDQKKKGIKIKKVLFKVIKNLPDNPKISRLNNNCFTISSKDLGEKWSPQYHDFKDQYKTIINELEQTESEKIMQKLNEMIAKKSIKMRGYTYYLHPEVINNLIRIL